MSLADEYLSPKEKKRRNRRVRDAARKEMRDAISFAVDMFVLEKRLDVPWRSKLRRLAPPESLHASPDDLLLFGHPETKKERARAYNQKWRDKNHWKKNAKERARRRLKKATLKANPEAWRALRDKENAALRVRYASDIAYREEKKRRARAARREKNLQRGVAGAQACP